MAKYLDLNGLSYLWEKIKEKLTEKVDKIEGKGLSTTDYTHDEKNKLTGIATNANHYVHPTSMANASGLYKITTNALGHVTEVASVTKTDITDLGIPEQDTQYTLLNFGVNASANELNFTKGVSEGIQSQLNKKSASDHGHSVASAALDGYLAKGDKTKLDGIAAGAQVNVLESVKVNGAALSAGSKAVNIDLTAYATKADISSVYKVKGSKTAIGELPTAGNTSGDVWNIAVSGANYVWTGIEWDKLSETVDLSGYLPRAEVSSVTNAEIDTLLAA